jgi:hypothetical protein
LSRADGLVTVAGMRAAIEYFIDFDQGCMSKARGAFLAAMLKSPLLADALRTNATAAGLRWRPFSLGPNARSLTPHSWKVHLKFVTRKSGLRPILLYGRDSWRL